MSEKGMNEKRMEINLRQFTVEELGEIWCNLNCFEWDDRLGDKPHGWDNDLIVYSNLYVPFANNKYNMVSPILAEIRSLIGEYWIARSWHLYKLGHTEEYFQNYWNGEYGKGK